MAALKGKTLLTCLVLGCVLMSTQAEKWRAIAKAFKRCDADDRAIYQENLVLTYSNKGELFSIAADVIVSRNVTLTLIKVTLFNMGGSTPIKFLYWEFKDPCTVIIKGHPYVDPIFASGEMPRNCELAQGFYPITAIHYDLHGQMAGASFRGNYILSVEAFSGDTSVYCCNVHGVIKRDSLH